MGQPGLWQHARKRHPEHVADVVLRRGRDEHLQPVSTWSRIRTRRPPTSSLTHLLEGGAAPISQPDVVPPFTRRTFDINAVPGLASAALSTIVASDVPIVAERAMYLNTTNRLWEGGAVGRGATALSTSWSFAEGATGFFHTYLCLGNPNDGTATVTVTYKLAIRRDADEVVLGRRPVAPHHRRQRRGCAARVDGRRDDDLVDARRSLPSVRCGGAACPGAKAASRSAPR